jgi:hypothetical protein
MCDFIVAMKMCEGDVHQINCDNHSYFQDDVFGNLYAICMKAWIFGESQI